MLPPFCAIVFPALRPSAVGIPDGAFQLLRAVAVIIFEVQPWNHLVKGSLDTLVSSEEDDDVFHFAVSNVFQQFFFSIHVSGFR